jgi:Cyclopropane fatty acid synthase and related methyltransferases
MPPVWFYDLMYRWRAPWEMGARSELVALVESGRVTPELLAPGRAVDLGCGEGANAVFLARAGFDVVGIDFSPVALRKAQRAALAAGVSERLRLVCADLTAPSLPGVEGPFDLLVDYGTLDDLVPTDRRAMASAIIRLARPGSIFVLYAFYATRADLPRISLTGPSRLVPVLEPGEEVELFGDAFEIERLPEPRPEHLTAAFVMTRRDHDAAGAG